jgi:hypothetical protein
LIGSEPDISTASIVPAASADRAAISASIGAHAPFKYPAGKGVSQPNRSGASRYS